MNDESMTTETELSKKEKLVLAVNAIRRSKTAQVAYSAALSAAVAWGTKTTLDHFFNKETPGKETIETLDSDND